MNLENLVDRTGIPSAEQVKEDAALQALRAVPERLFKRISDSIGRAVAAGETSCHVMIQDRILMRNERILYWLMYHLGFNFYKSDRHDPDTRSVGFFIEWGDPKI